MIVTRMQIAQTYMEVIAAFATLDILETDLHVQVDIFVHNIVLIQ